MKMISIILCWMLIFSMHAVLFLFFLFFCCFFGYIVPIVCAKDLHLIGFWVLGENLKWEHLHRLWTWFSFSYNILKDDIAFPDQITTVNRIVGRDNRNRRDNRYGSGGSGGGGGYNRGGGGWKDNRRSGFSGGGGWGGDRRGGGGGGGGGGRKSTFSYRNSLTIYLIDNCSLHTYIA